MGAAVRENCQEICKVFFRVQIVGLGSFYDGIYDSTGLGSVGSITEQPVLSPHNSGTDTLMKETASVLGLETFDEKVFTARISHIIVPEPNHLIYVFRDGHEEVRIPHRFHLGLSDPSSP